MKPQDPFHRHGLFSSQVPRYTSYPPATQFSSEIGAAEEALWLARVPEGSQVSLYIHIPFCRRLCWFCACRTQGTKTDAPLEGYVASVLEELRLVAARLPEGVTLSRLHLGGGTPTILPPPLMERLLTDVLGTLPLAKDGEFSVEVDPTECDTARLARLADFGLNRASIGVQDFDETVQEAIGRKQSYAITERVIADLRLYGVENVNIDILYGLPFQTRERLLSTLDKVIALAPQRIALFGYAHVPWMSKRQALIPGEQLPGPEERLALFGLAERELVRAGFVPVGIDHFARPGDGLAVALREHRLARNFQGYTDDRAPVLIGLGASSISRYPEGYVQNRSGTAAYRDAIAGGALAGFRGYRLTEADRQVGEMIEHLMCYGRVDIARLTETGPVDVAEALGRIARDFADVTSFGPDGLVLHDTAKPLSRIVAARMGGDVSREGRHSQAV